MYRYLSKIWNPSHNGASCMMFIHHHTIFGHFEAWKSDISMFSFITPPPHTKEQRIRFHVNAAHKKKLRFFPSNRFIIISLTMPSCAHYRTKAAIIFLSLSHFCDSYGYLILANCLISSVHLTLCRLCYAPPPHPICSPKELSDISPLHYMPCSCSFLLDFP